MTDETDVVGEEDQNPPVITGGLAGYVVLNVDWHEKQKSFLDNFISFILSVAITQQKQALQATEICKLLTAEYSIKIPERVVDQLLRKAAKSKLMNRNPNNSFTLTDTGKSQAIQAEENFNDLLSQQQKLVTRFLLYAKRNYELEVTEVEVKQLLIEYSEMFYGSLLSSSYGKGKISSPILKSPTLRQKYFAEFVAWTVKNDPECFEFLINTAKGNMLAAALFTTQKSVDIQKTFNDTKVLLDTKIVLRALGYEGEEFRIATMEYMNLLFSQGAIIGVFEFTLREAQGVLVQARESRKHGKLWGARPGTVGWHYFNMGATTGKIDLDIQQMEQSLRHLNILIEPSPPYEARYVIDENEITHALNSRVPQYSVAALQHDIKAITAVIRLRRGRARNSLEECKAVFVTLNTPLILASRELKDLNSEPWYVAMHEVDVATLAWIKSPPTSPDLPKHMILAICLGIIRPSEQVWHQYVEELEGLHTEEAITTEDLLVARLAIEQAQILGGSTSAPPDKLRTEITTSIAEFKSKMRSEIEGPLVSQIGAVKDSEIQLSEEIHELRAKLTTTAESESKLKAAESLRVRNLTKRISRVANFCGHLVSIALGGILFLATFFPNLGEHSRIWIIAARVVIVIAFWIGDRYKIRSLIANPINNYLLTKFQVIDNPSK